MVSQAIRTEGLVALSIAAAELIEDHHDELVSMVPEDPGIQGERMQRLRRLGLDLRALGEAGLALLENRVSD